jgi:signal peptidase I
MMHMSETEQTPTPGVDTSPSWLGALGRFAIELGEVVIISLAIILPIRYFLIQPFYVKGASMEPTFEDREYLIIDEISFRFRVAERGEVVVFRYPNDPRQYFIKRVIGLPGETVTVKDNQVTISSPDNPEGFILSETDYLPAEKRTAGDKSLTLEDDEYYVMGDNRGASLDSRTFGPLPERHIVGRVWIRGWPLDRVTLFDRQPTSL